MLIMTQNIIMIILKDHMILIQNIDQVEIL